MISAVFVSPRKEFETVKFKKTIFPKAETKVLLSHSAVWKII